MPANLKEIKRRIKSVKNTQQITRAMKLVSGAKLRRAQEAVEAARPFSARLQHLVGNLAAAGGKDPLLEEREVEERIQLVVLSADRGLCGSFNSNTLKAAQRFVDAQRTAQVSLNLVGRKALDFFKRRDVQILRHRIEAAKQSGVKLSGEISSALVEDFLEEKFDSIYVLYTRFRSAGSQEVTIQRLLPVERPEVGQPIEYHYDPSPEAILNELLPWYIRTQVHQYLLETAASEHGARMTAMENATRNASEMIDSLTLQYNRARQAAITTEIIEIVSGAEALAS